MERSKAEWLRKQEARLAHKRQVRTAAILHNLKTAVRADVAALGGSPAEQAAIADLAALVAIDAAVATDVAAMDDKEIEAFASQKVAAATSAGVRNYYRIMQGAAAQRAARKVPS